MNALSLATFSGLKQQLGTNSRLRLGLALIVGILWLYGVLELRDRLDAAASAYRAAAHKAARSQAAGNEKKWPERADQASILRSQLEGRLWRAATVGLAQASFQDWLNSAAQQAQLPRPSLSTSTETPETSDSGAGDGALNPPSFPADLIKVKAKLEFDFNPKTFNDFMLLTATHEKKIIVESLIIRTSPIPRVEMLLAAYFQKQSASAETGAARSVSTAP